MAPVATPPSAIDLRSQTLDNCKFFSRQDAELSLVVAIEPLGNFKALVLKAEDGNRDVLLTETAQSLHDAIYGIHAKSAAAVQNYISTNGFAFVSTVKKRRSRTSAESDEDDDDEEDGNDSDTASLASASSTVTVDELASSYESLSDNETVSVTSTCRLKKRNCSSNNKAAKLPSSKKSKAKTKTRRSRSRSPLRSRSHSPSFSDSEDDAGEDDGKQQQPLIPPRRPPIFQHSAYHHHPHHPGLSPRARCVNQAPPPPHARGNAMFGSSLAIPVQSRAGIMLSDPRRSAAGTHPAPPPPPPPPPPPSHPGSSSTTAGHATQWMIPLPVRSSMPNMHNMMHTPPPPPPPPAAPAPPAPPAPVGSSRQSPSSSAASALTRPPSQRARGHDVLLHITWRNHGSQRVLETIQSMSIRQVKDAALAYVRRCPSQFGGGQGVLGVEKLGSAQRLWGGGPGSSSGLSARVRGVNVDGADYDLSGWGGDDLGRVIGIGSSSSGSSSVKVVKFDVEVFSLITGTAVPAVGASPAAAAQQ